MAAPVGGLYIDMGANSAGLAADLGKARRAVTSAKAGINRDLAVIDRGFQKLTLSVGGFVRGLNPLASGAALAAAAAGMGAVVKRSVDAADALAKTAASSGFTTDALQELRHAADLSGVSIEQLDSGLSAFSKRIGELRANTGTLQTFLEKLDGTFAAQVRQAGNVDLAFDLVIGRMAEMTNQTDRAALGAAAFGRSAGVQMTNMVSAGTASLAEMRAEARRLGLVLDRDLLEGAEEANDAMARLASIMSAETSRAALQLTPLIVDMADALQEIIPLVRDFGSLIAKGWSFHPFALLRDLLKDDAEGLDELTEKAAGLRDELHRLGSMKAEATLDIQRQHIQYEIDSVNAALKVLEERIAAARAAAGSTGQKPPRIDITSGTLPSEDEIRRLKDLEGVNNTVDPFGGFQEGVEAARESLARMREEGKRIAEAVNPQVAYNNEVARLGELLRVGAIDQETYRRAMEQSKKTMEDATAKTDALADAANDLRDNAIRGQIRTWEDLRDVALRALQDIIIKMLEAKSVASAGGGAGGGGFGGVLAGFFGGLFGGGAGGATTAPGSLQGTNIGADGVLPFADGGRPPVGRPSLVGERGPELFTPGVAGTITPNHELGGGATVIVQQDFRGADDGVMARVHAMKRQIVAESTAAVFAAIADGGNAARAVGRRGRR